MNKLETYQTLLPQIESLVSGETDLIANMANVAAALHEAFGFWWTGFYRVEDSLLVLGPFQGPIACTLVPPPPIVRLSSPSSTTVKSSLSSTSTAHPSTPSTKRTDITWSKLLS